MELAVKFEKSVTNYRTRSKLLAGGSFLSLIFILNTNHMPRVVFGTSMSDIVTGVLALMFFLAFAALYYFIKFDLTLHNLNLTEDDLNTPKYKQGHLSSKIKRDISRKNRQKKRA